MRRSGPLGTFAVRSLKQNAEDFLLQELRAGRAMDEARLRGNLRAHINAAIHRHAMMRAEAHEILGLPPRSLDDGSLTTDALRQALDALRARPGGTWDPYAGLDVGL